MSGKDATMNAKDATMSAKDATMSAKGRNHEPHGPLLPNCPGAARLSVSPTGRCSRIARAPPGLVSPTGRCSRIARAPPGLVSPP